MPILNKLINYKKIIIFTVSSLVALFTFIQFTSDKKSSNNKLELETPITIENTVLSFKGIDEYEINASNITQNNLGIFLLNKVSGFYKIHKFENINIDALQGKLDQKNNKIILNQDVKINYLGYNLVSDSLTLDFDNKMLSSSAKVLISDDKIKVSADSFITEEEFNTIKLKGNVEAYFIIDNSNTKQ